MLVRSLFFRQLVSHIAVILFMAFTLSGSVMFFIYEGHATETETFLTSGLRNIANFFAAELKNGHIPDQREWQSAGSAIGAIIWLEDEKGNIIQGAPPENISLDSYQNLDSKSTTKINFSPESIDAIILSVPVTIKDQPGRIIACYTDDSIYLILRRVINFYFFPFIVGLIASFLLAMLLSRKLTRSIADIAATAKRFSSGNFASRTRFTGEDEIGELGKTFNSMADSILLTQQSRRNFFANISHELKTPLSCIKATTEALIDGIATNEQERTDYLERILSETDRMSRLVHDIMDTEQLESGKMHIRREKIDVAELLLHQADKLEPLLKEKRLSLLLRLETDKRYIWGDAGRLEQVLDNLLSNAIRYSPEESRIGLKLTEEKDLLNICVSDEGDGISEEELPLIWERFYRTDKSRNRFSGGNGLGLSISRGLVEAMGGTISAHSIKEEGTQFTIRIPYLK